MHNGSGLDELHEAGRIVEMVSVAIVLARQVGAVKTEQRAQDALDNFCDMFLEIAAPSLTLH